MQRSKKLIGRPVGKNIFLTGATGYLGSRLVKMLLNQGHQVYALVRPKSSLSILSVLSTEFENKLHYVQEDEIAKLPLIDVFIHTATLYGRNGEGHDDIFKTNRDLPLRLLETIQHKKITFINTDTSLTKGLNDYATSKKDFLDKALEVFDGEYFFNLVLEQFYGPSDNSFLSFVKKSLGEGRSVELTDGLQKRDFVYVDDIVSAYEFVLLKASTLEKGFHSFPVGSGESLSVKEVVSLLCEEMQKDPGLLMWGSRPKRRGEPNELKADIEMLKNMGWKPRTTIKEGIKYLVHDK